MLVEEAKVGRGGLGGKGLYISYQLIRINLCLRLLHDFKKWEGKGEHLSESKLPPIKDQSLSATASRLQEVGL